MKVIHPIHLRMIHLRRLTDLIVPRDDIVIPHLKDEPRRPQVEGFPS